MYKTTINQKRFLIIWICLHSFALFVNVFNIRGRLSTSNFISSSTADNYLFTSSSSSSYKNDFWPITNFTEEQRYYIEPAYLSFQKGTWAYKTAFKGIFQDYDYSEFIFYILLGLAVIYLPKIWYSSKP